MMISASTARTASLGGHSLGGQWLQVRRLDRVPPYLRSLVRQVEPFPAAVLDGRGQILACNRGYGALFGFAAVPEPSRNALLLYFTDPRMRRLIPEWHLDAPRVVSQFRAAMARHAHDPSWLALLATLRGGSAEVDRLWRSPEACHPGHGPPRFLHPARGP